ncbi:MAG: MarR family winged helix-turn-helix transcriptional regulator [Polyangiaceae bacterium]
MSTIDQATEFLETFARTKRSLGLVVWQAYAPLDIGPKQVLLMRELAEAGSLSQAELARATMTDPAATSRAVQTLVTLGWVRRVRNDRDQRERVVEITASGRAISKKIEAAYARAAKQVVASLDARDLADFRRVARKLLERCGELRDDCRAQCESLPPLKTSRARRRA